MAKTAPMVAGTHIIATPAVEIPLALLQTLAPVSDNSVNKSGIVLANTRESVQVMQDGKPVTYTVSVYVQRDAITSEEVEAVALTAAEREANAKKRADDETDKREREIKRAAELTRDAVLGTIDQQERRRAEARRLLGLDA